MGISKVLLILNLLFCKIPQSLLSHRCLPKGPGIIKCSGNVWIEPAPIIEMGRNVSINCHCMENNCQKGVLSLSLNNANVEDTLLSVINQTTVQLNLQNYNEPFSIVSCYLKTSGSRLICGTQFCMGYLPDKPANLTCIKPEQSNNMVCTWNPGKTTHLNTNYILYVKSLFTKENKGFVSNRSSVIIPLNQLQKNETFSISVHAENYLGGILSEELHVDLNSIVTPAVPVVVQNETIESPAFKTIIHWKRQTAIKETYCEERYKETISDTWHVRDWDANLRNELYTEYNLDANTKYEFQIRCKLTHPRSLWSRWSEATVYLTPEKEPAAVLDVWRKFGPVNPNSTQEVTVLIKPLSPKESRGKILNYRIFYEKQGENVELCKTTEIHCKVMVPPAVTIIYVTAHNSKGSSKPANIIVKQPPHNYQAFPPPTNIEIFTDKQKGISVKWEPPESIGKTLLWYIAEWISADFSHFPHSIAWKKVPFQNTSTSIEATQVVHMDEYNYYENIVKETHLHPSWIGCKCDKSISRVDVPVVMLVAIIAHVKQLNPNFLLRKGYSFSKGIPFLCAVSNITFTESIRIGKSSAISVYAVYQNGISRASSIQALMKEKKEQLNISQVRSLAVTTEITFIMVLSIIKYYCKISKKTIKTIKESNDDYDTGILLGTSVGVAFFSISVFTLIAIKSCRKRVNKMVCSVAPKWLFEEYPRMQNSKVIKYLQENDAVTDNFSEPFLDVVVTEVEEILMQNLYRAVEKKKGGSKTVSEKVSISEDVPFASSSEVTTRNGYKPQTSNKAQLGTTFSTTSETPFQNWDTNSSSIASPINNLRKDYTGPVAPAWPIVDPSENKSLFDKISLILRNSGSGQSRVGSKDEDPSTQKANQLRFLLSDEDIQEQTLIPDSLLSCLKTISEDPTNMSYFPQNTVYYEE